MTKKIIIYAIVILAVMGMTYVGVMNDMVQKAEADEQIVYEVHVMRNTEYGYLPQYGFEMSKPTLEAYVKLCWWEAEWLNSGDLLIGFDADGKTWFVTLAGNDPEIEEIRKLVNDYGLKCMVPDR